MVNQNEILSGASNEPGSDVADHRSRLGLASAVASCSIATLTAGFEADLVSHGRLGWINWMDPFFRGREQYVHLVFTAELLLPIVGFLSGGVACRHGSGTAKWLGVAGMITCFLVELIYVPGLLGGLRP
jgi:hypothetical protein